LSIFLFFQFLRILTSYLNEFSFTEEVKIIDLKPGMSLGEIITSKKGNYTKEHIPIITYFDVIRYGKKKISSKFSGKLSEEDIKKIKSLEKKGKIRFHSLKITKTLPFAPFMFLGVLLIYLLKQNIIFPLITAKDYGLLYLKILFYKIGLKIN
jgi:hypothetical protein